MDQPRPEVIVASTLYLMSAWVFDPSPCACRVRAIVAHLERMMVADGLDPVLKATAIQLHESWVRVEAKLIASASAELAQEAHRAVIH